jgi:hydroxymethylbilane synthase
VPRRVHRQLLIATRASPLALAQTRQIAGLLESAADVRVKVVPVLNPAGARRGVGDLDDKSRFVRGVDEAVLSRRADLAVHSAKDVPGHRPPELALAAVPVRADARDALCGAKSLAELPAGARVGTSSLRRCAQLLVARPDLKIVELHGNVDSRLRRLRDGDYDAIVLAAAGLQRLGLSCDGWLETEAMVPAPGQGALMLEARSDDAATIELAATINDAAAERALQAERTMASSLGATCHTPFGAFARPDGDGLALDAFVGAGDGSLHARVRARDPADALAALRRHHGPVLDAALTETEVAA